jgi:hypothetical protein
MYSAAVAPQKKLVLAGVFGVVVLGAMGCGRDSGPSTSNPPAQVRAVVERFGQATARKDYQTICDTLLARALVRKVEALGLPCEVALQRGLGDVRAPMLEVRQVVVRGDRALASVHSEAAGQAPSDDAIEVVKEDGDWRIASLAGSGATTTTTTPATTTPATTGGA